MINVPLVVWLVGGGALAAGLWLYEHDKRVRAEGRAEAQAEVIDSLRGVADSALAEVAHKDSTVVVQRVMLEAQQQQIAEVAAVARRQTQVAVASLRDELDDRQKEMLDTITSGFERQLAAKDSMFAAQVRLTTLAESQVDSRDIAIAKIQQASSVVYDAWEVEKKRARPGLITKVLRAVPVVAATVGLTLLVR